MDRSYQPRRAARRAVGFSAVARAIVAAGSLFLFLSVTAAFAGSQFVENGFAVSGYDTVAYQTEGKPIQGVADFTLQWNGATWRFASAANRDAFRADPSRYAPAYDGHCAYALSEGRKSGGAPELWQVANGRLFLLCSKNAMEKWTNEFSVRLAQAERNWRTLEAKPAATPKAQERPPAQ